MTDPHSPVPGITVLKALTAVRLDVAIWSARRKLTPADFGASDLPPEKLASLGSKKVCNPEDLRIFAALKARATAFLDRHGVRFLGGWAVPEARTALIAQELARIATMFDEAKQAFLASYHQSVRQWIAANPGWEQLIAGSVVDADLVRSRLSFGWQMFKVSPVRGQNGAASLEREVGGLAATLFAELATSAKACWKKSFAGKAELTHKALSPLKTMRAKLAGLSVIEPRGAPIVALIDACLAGLPEEGAIAGADLATLQGLVSLIATPDLLLAQGSRILEGADCEEILSELTSAVPLPQADKTTILIEEDQDAGMSGLDSLGLW